MSIKGLFDTIGDVWSGMPLRDKAAIATSPVPIVGDVVGAYADARHIGEQYGKTGKVPWLDVGMAFTGLLPWVPPAVAARSAKKGAKSVVEKALRNQPNYLPGFYSGNPIQKLGAVGYGAAQGAWNMAKQAHFPKRQGLWREYGISSVEQDVIKKSVKKIEGSYDPNVINKATDKITDILDSKGLPFTEKLAKAGGGLKGKERVQAMAKRAKDLNRKDFKIDYGDVKASVRHPQKKAMGEINKAILMSKQYGTKNFYSALDGMDYQDFANLSKADYSKLVKGTTGLNDDTMSAVFRAVNQVQGVDPKKVYRMGLRNPDTGASGKLSNMLYKGKVWGGSGIEVMSSVFKQGGKTKKFKTNLDLVEAMEAKGIKVFNSGKIREAAKKGKDNVEVIIQGSSKTDAYELGGANYITVVKKDGRAVSFMNDENDLAPIPLSKLTKGKLKDRDVKAPMADRMIAMSTPIHVDLLKARGADPRLPTGGKKIKDKLNRAKKARQEARIKVEARLPYAGKTPKHSPQGQFLDLQRPQWQAMKAISELNPKRAYIPAAGETIMTGLRLGKVLDRNIEGGLLPIDPLL